ncbi:MAG: hypothetical protein JWP06_952 [Candidatus Saccharibacteria bacterium]|nr:hypothetical protein [Candidatus Saccharibacteria bacterium]
MLLLHPYALWTIRGGIAMSRIIRAAVIALFPVIYLTLVWSICSAQADGIQVSWGFTRGFLLFAGVVCFGATILLTSFLNLPASLPLMAEEKVEDKAIVTHDHHVTVDMLPAYPREPLLQPDEQRLLIKVAAVTVVASLVVFQLFKRWNKKG